MNDADDLADALRRYDEVVGEYVHVHQQIHDGLPPARRKPRWWLPLAVLSVLVFTVPAMAYLGRAHFVSVRTWPTSATTGVPTGTTLTAYTGPCTITTDNTVIDSKLISCDPLEVRAVNVQITKSQTGRIWIDPELTSTAYLWSVGLTDSDVIIPEYTTWSAVSIGSFSLTRVEVQGGNYSAQCEAAPRFGNFGSICTIRDSYLHNQGTDPAIDSHQGGFISEGGPNVLTIDHNYIVCDVPVNPVGGGCTGDFNLLAWFGQMQDVTVTNNKFGETASTPRGPGSTAEYCIYGGPVAPNPTTLRVKFINNTFEKGASGHCGNSGPVASWDPTGTGNVWSGNVYDDGTPVPELT